MWTSVLSKLPLRTTLSLASDILTTCADRR